MGSLGVQEMICIFVLALLLFGPKKMPELGRMLGKGLAEFRRAKNELKTTFESHMREIEKEAELEKSASQRTTADYSPARPYSYPYDELGPTYENSESNYSNGFHNDSPSEPPVAELAPVNGEANSSQAEPEPAPVEAARVEVSGTVPRLNGTQPLEHMAVSSDEDHHA